MPHLPDLPKFRTMADGHQLVPVYRCVLSDTLTPVSAFRRLDDGGTACLFESVVGGEKVGRYSILACGPFMEVSARGTQVTLRRGDDEESLDCDDPLVTLHDQLASLKVAKAPELPGFTGGAVGYAGYDVVRYVEYLPNAPEDDRRLPDLSFAFYDHHLVFDHVQKTLYVVALARLDLFDSPDAAYADAARRVDEMVDRLRRPDDLAPLDIDTSRPPQTKLLSNFEPEQFEEAVRKCVEYIRAGDIFQVVLSQRFHVDVQSDPLEIYRTLRVVNPSPFMFLLRTGGVTLVGSSPEIMCRVSGGEVTVRPLAGTRRRGATDEEDRRLAEELLADPKERAEHVMLVDLGRNDVGRVAKFGSVTLSDVMVIERYSHVMHITSHVTGQLEEGRDAFDALRACLPAGTVSGAPKVRAMEIIDELEPHRRGPYAGAVGYFDYNGDMDTCIALRTLVIHKGRAYLQAGAGIVADSDPHSEYQETLNKARGLLQAIELTEQRTEAQRQ
ncbi:MAG: anthranilate synthase component I [Planctomycetales bacterium]|nr:anthranilate synthase component I [Planctomycetales bacterium]